jgi:hypothetical protein
MRRLVFAAVAAAALACACQTTPPVLTFRDFLSGEAQTYCDTLFHCCTPQQLATKFPDRATCVSTMSASFVQMSTMTQMGLDSGLLVFDADVATLCLDGQRGGGASCGASFWNVSGANAAFCSAVTHGTIAIGATCDYTKGGCVREGFCNPGTNTCVALAGAGQSCQQTSCTPGLACLTTLTCGVPQDDGAQCWDASQCKSAICTGTCGMSATVAQALCG